MGSRKKRRTMLHLEADLMAKRPPLDFNALDPGIRQAVRVLWEAGIETVQSCQGGKGHSYPEPRVEFIGGPADGFRAYGIAVKRGLRPISIRRAWDVINGELAGPYWEMIFATPTTIRWR